MTKPQYLFTLALALSTALVGCLHHWANAMTRWATEVPLQVPATDSRIVALQLNQRITTLTKAIDQRLLTLQSLTYRPQSVDAKANSPITISQTELPATSLPMVGGADAVDKRVGELLRSRLDWNGINELARNLDVKRHPLPSEVTLRCDALFAWIQLRSRWPEPVGLREVNGVPQHFGFLKPWLGTLRPNVPEHVALVIDALDHRSLDANAAVDWFNRGATFPIYGPGYRMTHTMMTVNYRQAVASGDEQQIARALTDAEHWIFFSADRELFDPFSLSVVSEINHPRTWAFFAKSASLPNRPRDALVRALDFSRWHQLQVDQSADSVLRALFANPALPRANWELRLVENNATQPDGSISAPETLAEADGRLSRWLLFDGPSQEALLKMLLQSTPDAPLRRDALTFANSARFAAATEGTLASVLASRWSDSPDFAGAWSRATNAAAAKNITLEMDATAEAITAFCRLHPQAIDQLARFWMQQSRWTREVQLAWQSVGSPAEAALCESLLAMDPGQHEPGTQAALETLAVIGGDSTLTTLEVLTKRILNAGVESAGLDRFIRFCESRIRRRLAAPTTPAQDTPP